MSKQPDHSHGTITERGITVVVDKDTWVPSCITGRTTAGRMKTLLDWDTSVPIDALTFEALARAYGFADPEEFAGELRRRGFEVR